jgi:nuclear transport factor 2 (NTF2) superfamily protein
MRKRVMLGNDVKIAESERKFRWDHAERAAVPLAAREFSYNGNSEAFYH